MENGLDLTEDVSALLPTKAVKKGDKWDIKSAPISGIFRVMAGAGPNGAFPGNRMKISSVTGSAVCTLEDYSDYGSKKCAKIKFDLNATLIHAETPQWSVTRTMKVKLPGYIYFSVDDKRIVSILIHGDVPYDVVGQGSTSGNVKLTYEYTNSVEELGKDKDKPPPAPIDPGKIFTE